MNEFFRLRMLAVWANDGSFKILAELPETDENSMDEEGEDEDVDDE